MTSSRPEATAHGPNRLPNRVATLPGHKQAELLRRLRQSVAPDRWFVRHQHNPDAAVRLFCFSYAGGGASAFRGWPAALSAAVEVWSVQLPGRESRIGEPPYRRIAPLIGALKDAIGPHLDEPFVFFGHSMGALVAFELARELRRSSIPGPARLFLGAFRAPHLPSPHVKIYHWPDEVLKVVLRADGTPARVLQDDELMRAMLPTLRADLEVCDTYEYVPEAPLDCPFSVFGGGDDRRVPATDLERWRIHTTSTCSVTILPGSHLFLQSAQQLLLNQMQRDLEKDRVLRKGYHSA